jgi:hypothetical protein
MLYLTFYEGVAPPALPVEGATLAPIIAGPPEQVMEDKKVIEAYFGTDYD